MWWDQLNDAVEMDDTEWLDDNDELLFQASRYYPEDILDDPQNSLYIPVAVKNNTAEELEEDIPF